MKTTKTILLLFLSVILCTSCSKKDDNEPSTDTSVQSITTSGTLSGTISNYTIGVFDELKFSDNFADDSSISSCTISSDGKFTMTLPIPTLKLLTETSYFPDLTLSDVNVQMGGGEFSTPEAYKSGSFVGYVIKSSTKPNLNLDFIGTTTNFYYFDRACTIKGTSTSTSIPWKYDMSIKKGWNEIAFIVSSTEITFTTTIPAGLKWYFVSEE